LFKPKYAVAIAIGWLGLVTFLMCTPGTKFPKLDWQDKVMLDKWIHIFLLGVLTIACCRAYISSSKRKSNILTKNAFLVITLLVILYGITMEFVQKNWVPFRSFDSGDIVADAIGAVIGFLIAVKLFIKNKTRSTGL
jgi:VanZ family protein